MRRANLPTSIAERLRAQIAQGRLQPGTRLPGHRELAAMYSVSVGSVREAISMLVSEGLVATHAGRGTFVLDGGDGTRESRAAQPLDRGQVAELIEAREVLETQIAAFAAERASPEQVCALRALVARMQAAVSDAAPFVAADVDFHVALAEAAGNRFLLRSMNGIRDMLRRDLELSVEVDVRRPGDLQLAVQTHGKLVERIAARDSFGARCAIADIVRRNRDFVLNLYASPDVSAQPDGAR